MQKYLNTLVQAFMAGVCIALGGIAFLSIQNPVVGALFFTIGLFTICTKGYLLFTGKVCYCFENKLSYIPFLAVVWLGNLLGTYAAAMLVRATRIAKICERAGVLCETKLNDSLLSVFILAVFCNILIYIAVDGFKENSHEIGKYIALFLGVAGFILCGFEHCVANMFYFSVANAWSGKTLLYLLVMTLGNAVGGLIFPAAKLVKKKCEA